MLKRTAYFAFLLLSLLELGTHLFRWPDLHRVVKPLLMPALLWWYFTAAGAGGRSVAVVAALVFSWGGDVLLLFQHDSRFFIFGLAAFLVAQALYIFAYRLHQRPVEGPPGALDNVRKLRMALPVLLAGIGLVVVLYPSLGEYRFPVVAYASVIQAMVIAAIFRWGRTAPASFRTVLAGALLFMVSDAMIAVNKFYAPLPDAGFWIMLTYLAGQLLIVRGLLAHKQP